ncbi:hypothetical protein M8J77_015700 [Diaphorina citri]|nr:hypothetical protein M8J77_015700 [Diaphorina citri]
MFLLFYYEVASKIGAFTLHPLKKILDTGLLYVAPEVPAHVACGPHTHGSWKSLVLATSSRTSGSVEGSCLTPTSSRSICHQCQSEEGLEGVPEMYELEGLRVN